VLCHILETGRSVQQFGKPGLVSVAKDLVHQATAEIGVDQ
jgi:hypothetical protein